jgi:hypothetical protein
MELAVGWVVKGRAPMSVVLLLGSLSAKFLLMDAKHHVCAEALSVFNIQRFASKFRTTHRFIDPNDIKLTDLAHLPTARSAVSSTWVIPDDICRMADDLSRGDVLCFSNRKWRECEIRGSRAIRW